MNKILGGTTTDNQVIISESRADSSKTLPTAVAEGEQNKCVAA